MYKIPSIQNKIMPTHKAQRASSLHHHSIFTRKLSALSKPVGNVVKLMRSDGEKGIPPWYTTPLEASMDHTMKN